MYYKRSILLQMKIEIKFCFISNMEIYIADYSQSSHLKTTNESYMEAPFWIYKRVCFIILYKICAIPLMLVASPFAVVFDRLCFPVC